MSAVTHEHVNVALLWEPKPAGATVQLRASRCTDCQRWEFPAVTGCPACGGVSEEVALGPKAVLHGFTEVLHAPPDAKVPVPYTVAVAAFADANLAVMGLLEGHVPAADLAIGDALEVCVLDYGDGLTYAFRPL